MQANPPKLYICMAMILSPRMTMILSPRMTMSIRQISMFFIHLFLSSPEFVEN